MSTSPADKGAQFAAAPSARGLGEARGSAADRLFNYRRSRAAARYVRAIRIDCKRRTRRDLLLRAAVCARSSSRDETIYRHSNRRNRHERDSVARYGAAHRYRTVDAWPIIPISRWHLRAAITAPSIRSDRYSTHSISLLPIRSIASILAYPQMERVDDIHCETRH